MFIINNKQTRNYFYIIYIIFLSINSVQLNNHTIEETNILNLSQVIHNITTEATTTNKNVTIENEDQIVNKSNQIVTNTDKNITIKNADQVVDNSDQIIIPVTTINKDQNITNENEDQVVDNSEQIAIPVVYSIQNHHVWRKPQPFESRQIINTTVPPNSNLLYKIRPDQNSAPTLQYFGTKEYYADLLKNATDQNSNSSAVVNREEDLQDVEYTDEVSEDEISDVVIKNDDSLIPSVRDDDVGMKKQQYAKDENITNEKATSGDEEDDEQEEIDQEEQEEVERNKSDSVEDDEDEEEVLSSSQQEDILEDDLTNNITLINGSYPRDHSEYERLLEETQKLHNALLKKNKKQYQKHHQHGPEGDTEDDVEIEDDHDGDIVDEEHHRPKKYNLHTAASDTEDDVIDDENHRPKNTNKYKKYHGAPSYTSDEIIDNKDHHPKNTIKYQKYHQPARADDDVVEDEDYHSKNADKYQKYRQHVEASDDVDRHPKNTNKFQKKPLNLRHGVVNRESEEYDINEEPYHHRQIIPSEYEQQQKSTQSIPKKRRKPKYRIIKIYDDEDDNDYDEIISKRNDSGLHDELHFHPHILEDDVVNAPIKTDESKDNYKNLESPSDFQESTEEISQINPKFRKLPLLNLKNSRTLDDDEDEVEFPRKQQNSRAYQRPSTQDISLHEEAESRGHLTTIKLPQGIKYDRATTIKPVALVSEDNNAQDTKKHEEKKAHKKPVNTKYKKGGGKEHDAEHYSKHGEKGDKSYKGSHKHEKGQKGHHDKEVHKGSYDDKGGSEKKHHHEDGHFSGHKKGEKGEKGAKFAEHGKHEKGHSTKGEHNIHKKDEYEKKHEFFDEYNESGESEKHGAFHQEHAGHKGGSAKGGHHKSGYEHGEHGKKGKKEEGGHYHHEKGHKNAAGHDEHHEHEAKYGKKSGHDDGKKWSYKKKG